MFYASDVRLDDEGLKILCQWNDESAVPRKGSLKIFFTFRGIRASSRLISHGVICDVRRAFQPVVYLAEVAILAQHCIVFR